MTVYNSTQNPNGTRPGIARALGVEANQITVIGRADRRRVRRQAAPASLVGAQAAVAARKLNRPVRLLYDRATDTLMVGKRHPYLGEYHIAFTPEGILEGAPPRFAIRCRRHLRLLVRRHGPEPAPVGRLLPGQDASRPTARSTAPTSPATRPSARSATSSPIVVVEDAMEHVAHQLSRTLGRRVLPEEIRRKNLYRTGSRGRLRPDPLRPGLCFCNIREIWDDLYRVVGIRGAGRRGRAFNRANRWRKRGIAMIPQKYGISFTEPRGSLNASRRPGQHQHGRRVGGRPRTAAWRWGRGCTPRSPRWPRTRWESPWRWIRVGGNNSDAIVNAPATAASTGFDLNGGAVEKACRVLRSRLEDFCRDVRAVHSRTTASSTGDTTGRALAGDRLQAPGSTGSTSAPPSCTRARTTRGRATGIRPAGPSSISSTRPRRPRWRSTC